MTGRIAGRWIVIAVSLGVLLWQPLGGPTASAAGEGQADLVWIRQFGTTFGDVALAVAADPSGVYVAGLTEGTFEGETNTGSVDAFLRKYDAEGAVVWTRQLGSLANDAVRGVAVDASGVYVAGWTEGTFEGETSAGSADAFLRKYGSDGNVLWTRQFGTSQYDSALSIALDSSGAYVAGETFGTFPGEASWGWTDAFLRKYDSDGNVLWTRQFGTSVFDEAFAVAVDTSGVYIAGRTLGTFPGETSEGEFDALLRKYGLDGDVLWTRQFGTGSYEHVSAVATNGFGVYVAGMTEGALPGHTNAGRTDAFLRKYGPDGDVLWTRQLGTSELDWAAAVAVDGSGAYVAGATDGTLLGETSNGARDAFLRKYAPDGDVLWTRQIGTSEFDDAIAVAVDGSGAYVAGLTVGIFPGETSAGVSDAFLAKLGAFPPSALCPRGQGFWRTHPDAWPVDSVPLGAETYKKAGLLDLLRTRSRADASLILAHQLIAAKLNVASGADPTPIDGGLDAADASLRAFSGKLPYGVRPSTSQGRDMAAAAEVLDAYNNGKLTPDCRDGLDGAAFSLGERSEPGARDTTGSSEGKPLQPHRDDAWRLAGWATALASAAVRPHFGTFRTR